MSPKQLMVGYILFDESGRKLTRHLKWSERKEAGWLWSDGEANAVTEFIRLMEEESPVMYYQLCELVLEDSGDNNVYALDKPQKLEGE